MVPPQAFINNSPRRGLAGIVAVRTIHIFRCEDRGDRTR